MRRPDSALRSYASIGRVPPEAILLVGSTHHAEVLNRVPGTMIQRGSGQESLTAIRSPVLTGPGSCGAFLMLENSVPIRPVGFCNVNEMFEINTEQAQAIEVLRGPSNALYGSNAVHGVVNVLQPAAGRLAGARAGPGCGTRRLRATEARDGAPQELPRRLGVAALYTHDGGWRDSSGFDEGKLNATMSTTAGDTPLRVDLAGTILDQQTAGFIVGEDAYRDESVARSNPNPEAFRKAHALRLTGLMTPAAQGGARIELRPYVRSSRMEFLQHFLLGKPLERNGQESLGLMSSVAWDSSPDRSIVAGVDLELGDSYVIEVQDGPTTDGPPAANAIRPAGLHYDYEVQSAVAGAYIQAEQRLSPRWTLGAGLRAEYVHYDYDNRMLSGNTDEAGVPCTPTGCLYSRPADRSDDFDALAPKLSLSYSVAEGVMAYAAASRGFRPPEMTELYRLQRQQNIAELESEQLDALELGFKAELERVRLSAAVFDMDKRDVILRDANGFNVSNGRTSHQGVEYELLWQATPSFALGAAGTWARHRYEFSSAIEGGETIVDGNDVDTAPRQVHTATLRWNNGNALVAEAEWLHVGKYWLDAANAQVTAVRSPQPARPLAGRSTLELSRCGS